MYCTMCSPVVVVYVAFWTQAVVSAVVVLLVAVSVPCWHCHADSCHSVVNVACAPD